MFWSFLLNFLLRCKKICKMNYWGRSEKLNFYACWEVMGETYLFIVENSEFIKLCMADKTKLKMFLNSQKILPDSNKKFRLLSLKHLQTLWINDLEDFQLNWVQLLHLRVIDINFVSRNKFFVQSGRIFSDFHVHRHRYSRIKLT